MSVIFVSDNGRVGKRSNPPDCKSDGHCAFGGSNPPFPTNPNKFIIDPRWTKESRDPDPFMPTRNPDLKFDVDLRWGEKRSWFQRLCARVVVKMIFNSKGETYQFGGWTGAKRLAYEMVDADKFQVMHWILREVGYECCPADVMRRCGVDPEKRDV